jgi:hypothetical protein
VSELSPHGADASQGRPFSSLVGFILLLTCGCSSPPRRNLVRTQPDDTPSMQHRPIETTRANRGEVRVEATIQEPQPLTGYVEIKTWANEVVRGRILSEKPEGYELDVGPPDGSNPSIRLVRRSTVMELKNTRR